jgi:hypothetical protein
MNRLSLSKCLCGVHNSKVNDWCYWPAGEVIECHTQWLIAKLIPRLKLS